MDHKELQYNIPQDISIRKELISDIELWLAQKEIIPPIPFDQLAELASEFTAINDQYFDYTAFILIIINNAIWRDSLSGIEQNKRLLLLPKCLASSAHCKGENDNFGLICAKCKQCRIPEIEKLADELGYVTLIAEGSPIVAELIRTGQISAIIGVSCLEGLEKAFNHITEAAIPAYAVPLLNDGCKDTTVDLELLKEILKLKYNPKFSQPDYQQTQTTVRSWFEMDNLQNILSKYGISSTDGLTAKCAIEYVADQGKRNRPFITAAIYQACSNNTTFPEEVIATAIAIEFFHKASLIHDDIEDHDKERDGRETLNARFGNDFAINAGDYLIGCGYRLLASLNISPELKSSIISIIAQCHQELTIGQGLELENKDKEISLETTLEIFKGKTSPAFYAALSCGGILADADPTIISALEDISQNLGIAYQINDDIKDYPPHNGEMSILNCYKDVPESQKTLKAEQLLEHYLEQAREPLNKINTPKLKILLAKIINRIAAN